VDLSIELMMEYLHETVLPQMVATEQNKEFKMSIMKQQQRHSNDMGLAVSAQQMCTDG